MRWLDRFVIYLVAASIALSMLATVLPTLMLAASIGVLLFAVVQFVLYTTRR